jgi:hypothetical protein
MPKILQNVWLIPKYMSSLSNLCCFSLGSLVVDKDAAKRFIMHAITSVETEELPGLHSDEGDDLKEQDLLIPPKDMETEEVCNAGMSTSGRSQSNTAKKRRAMMNPFAGMIS